MDHFYYNSRLYLIVCDYFSKCPFIFQAKSTTFANIKEQLEELFGLEDTPDEIMSDNDLPPFSSKEFNSFLSGLSIKHTTSSPNYLQSNGFIERQIQTGEAHGESQFNRKEFPRGIDQLESNTHRRRNTLASRDTTWEKPCNKEGNFC